jgi:hypothetical protein
MISMLSLASSCRSMSIAASPPGSLSSASFQSRSADANAQATKLPFRVSHSVQRRDAPPGNHRPSTADHRTRQPPRTKGPSMMTSRQNRAAACVSGASVPFQLDPVRPGLAVLAGAAGRAYVLRVASSFILTLTAGTAMTCTGTMRKLLRRKRTGRSAPRQGIEGRALVRLGRYCAFLGAVILNCAPYWLKSRRPPPLPAASNRTG